jgi:hypothetical protein
MASLSRAETIAALRSAASLLCAKGPRKVKDYTAEEATKYKSEKGRCPTGWHYNRRLQICQVKRPKATVPEKAPQIEGVSSDINDTLTALHKESLPAKTIPPVMDSWEVRDFRKKNDPITKEWFDSLSKEEQTSLEDYTLDSFSDVNGYLRFKRKKEGMPAEQRKRFEEMVGDDPILVKIANNVSSALNKASLPEAVTVQRGTINPDIVDKFKSGKLVGQSVKTDQFYSTTVDQTITKDFLSRTARDNEDETPVMWNIALPKGAKAMSLGATSKYPLESEVLLNEGSELNIVNAEMRDGVLHLHAEYRGP